MLLRVIVFLVGDGLATGWGIRGRGVSAPSAVLGFCDLPFETCEDTLALLQDLLNQAPRLVDSLSFKSIRYLAPPLRCFAQGSPKLSNDFIVAQHFWGDPPGKTNPTCHDIKHGPYEDWDANFAWKFGSAGFGGFGKHYSHAPKLRVVGLHLRRQGTHSFRKLTAFLAFLSRLLSIVAVPRSNVKAKARANCRDSGLDNEHERAAINIQVVRVVDHVRKQESRQKGNNTNQHGDVPRHTCRFPIHLLSIA
jgi:hypothetical protein